MVTGINGLEVWGREVGWRGWLPHTGPDCSHRHRRDVHSVEENGAGMERVRPASKDP